MRKYVIPKYSHHKASGQARVIIDGRQIYLGKYGSDESREKYGRLIAEIRAGRPSTARTPTDADDITVVEIIAAFLKWAEQHYVKNGQVTSEYQCFKQALRHVNELYGTTVAAQFGPLALKSVRQKLLDTGDYSRGTINKHVGRIKKVFRWAVENELVPPSLYHALQAVCGLQRGRTTARESKPILPVDDATVDATLPHLPPVVADMVRFQRLVGCRPGEVCNLRPCDVDASGDVWVYVPESHKTEHHGRERRIFIGPKAQDVLRPYLLREKTAYCFSPIDGERKRHAEMREARKTKVQPSQVCRKKAKPKRQPTDHYTKETYYKAVCRAAIVADKAAKKLAGVKAADAPRLVAHWHPNQLRHSVATTIRRSYGIEGAQVCLGHSTADVTQVYAERDFALAERIMRQIG